MKHSRPWPTFFLFVLMALTLQSCLGIGGGGGSTAPQGNFKNTTTNNGSQQIGVNTDVVFKGQIYFTQGRNIFMLDGTRTQHNLTNNVDARDPALSPDKKTL